MLVTDLSLHREFELSTQAQPSNDTFNGKHIARDFRFCTDVGNGAGDKRNCIEDGACFAAGTLVHTKEGLVPIEQIKVGDWVLSKPENGGEQAYKRVVKTFAHKPTTVMRVGYSLRDDPDRFYPIISTLNHPFWVTDEGWTEASRLPDGFGGNGPYFELVDGASVQVNGCGSIYLSSQEGIGWLPSHMEDVRDRGALTDFLNNKLIATEVFAIDAVRNDELEDPYFKLPVHNLEVEDFHTYYVGKHGVWVHNTNCGGYEARVAPIKSMDGRYE
ncbi:polymorphic toxin-type HINT domain-containing protein [Undibacterium cyanobacteriorum]|uniref:Polymorphic toxin-type HINT domain-containing protein n=1 Tax=Undibacterium cyanobacteriorum TaxID=3073561 RepID=A0ABY9RHE0_9BURK|nr:polymorphic toxin-type HINT domain-containing protein [Undibacterium sp. 20NA77.5]WMW80630.1 polymorphic toxin-type HINT domain-containing protein [Undibacterium sp. 20NA77.5]